MLKFYQLCCFLAIMASVSFQTFSQESKGTVNLLLNPNFEFHSFVNHREGKPVSYASNNVAFWNTDSWG
ncbi:MAG: hypothetical protein M0Q53_15625, partial [Prolixibacteraceae bacterium]|nr:hypothetical protein [Prolixibacteraceae bacterium]